MTIRADQDRNGPTVPFRVPPGADALDHLHLWLDRFEASGAIGKWFAVGFRADQRETLALVEFENDEDGLVACAAWQKRL